MTEPPVKKEESTLTKQVPRNIRIMDRIARKISLFSRARSINRRARELEREGWIKLGVFDTLDLLKQLAPHDKDAERLHDGLNEQMDIAVDPFRLPGAQVHRDKPKVPLDKLLAETKSFLEGPKGLRAYARYKKTVADEFSSQRGGALAEAIFGIQAARLREEALAARLAAYRLNKRKQLRK